MRLVRLSLTDFRNYRSLELALPPTPYVIFYGDNAQGKTNLLEAVAVLAATRSPRATIERELIGWDAVPRVARLYGEVARAADSVAIEVALREDDAPGELADGEAGHRLQKRIRVNGVPRRAADAIGELLAVMFAPEDIGLVSGTPSLRRRCLDLLCSQLDRAYGRALQRYQRLVEQRNFLLRLIRDHRAAVDELAFWDEQLVALGAGLLRGRLAALAGIGPLAETVHLGLSSGAERLSLDYRMTIGAGDNDIEGRFREALRRLQPREIGAGASLIGPHRDDFSFVAHGERGESAAGVDLGTYGSRAQQRTAALSLRLAEARLLKATRGDAPVLLLDDVLSELDQGRRRYLLAAAEGFDQVLFTATDLSVFDARLREAAVAMRVERGTVQPD